MLLLLGERREAREEFSSRGKDGAAGVQTLRVVCVLGVTTCKRHEIGKKRKH